HGVELPTSVARRGAVDRDSWKIRIERADGSAILRARERSAEQPSALAATAAIRSWGEVRGDRADGVGTQRGQLVVGGVASRWHDAAVPGGDGGLHIGA